MEHTGRLAYVGPLANRQTDSKNRMDGLTVGQESRGWTDGQADRYGKEREKMEREREREREWGRAGKGRGGVGHCHLRFSFGKNRI